MPRISGIRRGKEGGAVALFESEQSKVPAICLAKNLDLGQVAKNTGGEFLGNNSAYWVGQEWATGATILRKLDEDGKLKLFLSCFGRTIRVENYGAVLRDDGLILVAPVEKTVKCIIISRSKTPNASQFSVPEDRYRAEGLSYFDPSIGIARSRALEAKRIRVEAGMAAKAAV
jgi:hypothetical protein